LNWLCCKHSSCREEIKARAWSDKMSHLCKLWAEYTSMGKWIRFTLHTFHARCADFVNSCTDNGVWYPCAQSSLPRRSLSQISTQDVSKVDLLHKGRIHICSFQSS
jgi:hypothetical protein